MDVSAKKAHTERLKLFKSSHSAITEGTFTAARLSDVPVESRRPTVSNKELYDDETIIHDP